MLAGLMPVTTHCDGSAVVAGPLLAIRSDCSSCSAPVNVVGCLPSIRVNCLSSCTFC